MSCWRDWKPRSYEHRCKLSSSRNCICASGPSPETNPKREAQVGSGGILFIRNSRREERETKTPGRVQTSGKESKEKSCFWILNLFQRLPLISQLGVKVDVFDNSSSQSFPPISSTESTSTSPEVKKLVLYQRGAASKIVLPKPKPKMEHTELVKELSHIEKLTNQERLKLAHNRRKLQLKYWNQYEKLLNNSSVNGGNNNKKGIIGKNSQQQRLLEQLQQQEQLRRSKSKNNKPKVRFRSSIMLLEAAGRNDIVEVRRLLQDGVNPDVANEDGLTALHQCCIDDNEDMMRLLIDSGANVNSEDSEKWTPLHAAATCGHLHLVKHLIAKGANLLPVNAEGNMPYDICDEEETLDFIESEMARRGVTQELIEEIRARPETQMLEEMERIQMEDEDLLEYRDQDGATYLHIAAANGYVRVVEFLLDHHVATDVQDKDCWQPVHAAACWGHVEVLELLVQNGADLNARTKNNESPYAICEDLEIKERIVQLRSEQETKMRESGVKKLRRSVSSNSRTQSIRRTSQRDKGLTTKRDTADEAAILLAVANNPKDASPSPTGDVAEGIVPNHEHQTSITSSEEGEIRSLPPWSQGRDSITQLHLEALGFPKSPSVPLENESSSAEESPKLNNSTNSQSAKGLKNLSYNNNTNLIKEKNELNNGVNNGSVRSTTTTTTTTNTTTTTTGTKFQNPVSVAVALPVSNPSLTTDTNANLPKPDVSPSPHVDLPKLSSTGSTPAPTGDSSGVRINDTTDNIGGTGNSTIDIRVQVTINTNSSNGSLDINNGSSLSPSPPNGTQIVQVTNGPLFTQPGTLSDLKKHRSLQYISISRNSTFPLNGLKELSPKYEAPSSPSTSLKKFAGNAGELVGDYGDTKRKCCSIV